MLHFITPYETLESLNCYASHFWTDLELLLFGAENEQQLIFNASSPSQGKRFK